jgi:autotransporter-associated beta strand protein
MSRLVVCFFLFAQSVWGATQTNLYVSPTGSGSAFSQAQPGNLVAARDIIRTLNASMTGDIVVHLSGGTYPLTNGFQLREDSGTHDSGTGGFNIIYQAQPGETPVFSGGLVVSNWTLFDAGRNIWRAFVGTAVNSRQLYVNDLRAVRVRGPLNPSGFVTNSTGFNTTNLAMQTWANQTNIEIVCRNAWKHLRCPVAAITGTNIVMQTPCWTFTGNSPAPGPPWNGNGHRSMNAVTWVENAYELMGSPGMWYLNQATGYLYYIPRPGENLASASVVLPVAEKLIDASGSPGTPIHNLVFSGITFAYATWLGPGTSAGYADNQTGIQWQGLTGASSALKALGNLSFQSASNITLSNNSLVHLGGTAIDFGSGAHGNVVLGNVIDDISAGGVTLGEVTDYATTDPDQMTDGNVIRDNFIRRAGQDYEDTIAIWVGYSKNTIIAHNDIDNLPYSGISLGWGWNSSNVNYSANNQVVGNLVGKVMQTLTDGGSCYTLGQQTNSIESGNYYKDSVYHGIYWDEGSAYWTASSNVFDNPLHNYVNIHSSSGTLNNHDNLTTNNFSNVTAASNPNTAGAADVITNTVFVTRQAWPAAAQSIILAAGLEPAYAALKSPEFLVNDTEPNFDHVPTNWTYSASRTLGDYHSDVHYTLSDGQYVQYSFSASSIAWLGEMNVDMGNVDVWLDGVFQSTVNCSNSTRLVQQRLFAASGLARATHTLKLVKNGGTYLMLDAFAVVPTNFWLTLTPPAVAVVAGNSTNSVLKLDVFSGFSGGVALGVSGLPPGCTASFSPATVTGAGFSTLTIGTSGGTPGGTYALTITGIGGGVTNTTTLGLAVTGLGANLAWNAATNSAWDVLTSSNWLNLASSARTQFNNGDAVLLDDTAGLTNTLTIASGAVVAPAAITNNSAVRNYTIGGAGKITGTLALIKTGNSLLSVNTTNDFAGSVSVLGGTLRAGNAAALGTASVTISNGTLDVNGLNLTALPVVVSGAGFNSNGAVINSGPAQTSGLRQVTLAGDVTFGGTNRWDIRNTGGTASLATRPAGSAFNITKIGTNQVSLVAVSSIDSALGDIDIQQGEFAVQTSTTQLGDPAKTITVRSNAILEVWALSGSPLNKQIVLNDGATVFNESGTSIIIGPLTLQGNDTFNVGGTSLVISNVLGGAGNLVKSGAGTLVLAASNTFTGNTVVTNGTLSLAGAGALSGAATISLGANTLLDVTGRGDQSLNLASGQTLTGNGTVTGNLFAMPGSIISPLPAGPALVGRLTVTAGATLRGTTFLRLDLSHVTNDVLQAGGGVVYGGILSVSNLNGSLVAGNNFKLFAAANFSGAFAALLPPSPGAGLAWDTTGLTNGILKVAAVTQPPRIGSLSLQPGPDVVLSGSNGTPGGVYYVLGSTNVALPLTNWLVLSTNLFNGNGTFNVTNPAHGVPAQFLLLRLP